MESRSFDFAQFNLIFQGLVGILLAVFAVFGVSTALSFDLGNVGGVILMIVMIACLLAFSLKKKKN